MHCARAVASVLSAYTDIHPAEKRSEKKESVIDYNSNELAKRHLVENHCVTDSLIHLRNVTWVTLISAVGVLNQISLFEGYLVAVGMKAKIM